MTLKKILRGSASAVAVLGVVVLLSGSTASALAATKSSGASATAPASRIAKRYFKATGFATSFVNTITNPPQIGQGFILEEDLINPQGVKIGTDHIECTVVAFTTTALQFVCTATFTFNDGTIRATTTFSSNQVNYDALIIGGTGAYTRAVGFIHVTDNGPGNPTGYIFDFVLI